MKPSGHLSNQIGDHANERSWEWGLESFALPKQKGERQALNSSSNCKCMKTGNLNYSPCNILKCLVFTHFRRIICILERREIMLTFSRSTVVSACCLKACSILNSLSYTNERLIGKINHISKILTNLKFLLFYRCFQTTESRKTERRMTIGFSTSRKTSTV